MRAAAHFFSVVFHPLLVLTYMTLVLLWTNPFSFGWRHVGEADSLLIIIVATTFMLPALAVGLMKALGWVTSFSLPTREERIGPYIASGILYLSLYLHIERAGSFPLSLKVAVLGTLAGLWACFFINNFRKVSVHAAGMGGLTALTLLNKLVFGYANAQIGLTGGATLILPVDILLYAVIVLSGIVCTSRLILNAHTTSEVYLGYVVGLATVTLSYFILW
jgi:hypothetical protein